MTHRIFALISMTLVALAVARADENPEIRCLAFAPDGKTLAVGSTLGEKSELSLLASPKLGVHWREAQPARVRAMAFLPDGKGLVAAVGTSLLLIDPATGKTLRTLGKHDKAITALTLTPDGKSVASGGADGVIKLWDIARGAEIRKLRDGAAISALAFAPDGKRLAWAADRETGVLDAASGKALHKFSGEFLNHCSSVLFLPDGTEVMAGSYDCTARLYDASSGAKKAVIQPSNSVYGLAYSPATKSLVAWTVVSLDFFAFDREPDADTKKRIATLIARLDDDDFEKRESAEADLVKVGFRAEAALREAKKAKSAEVRIRARRALQTILSKPPASVRRRDVTAMALSPSGEVVAVGGADGVALYDMAGKAIK